MKGGSSETRIFGRSGELQVGCESPSSFLQITQRFSTRFTARLPATKNPKSFSKSGKLVIDGAVFYDLVGSRISNSTMGWFWASGLDSLFQLVN